MDRPPQDKPWAKLRRSRREYETARPWKAAGMDRRMFESLVAVLPDDAVEAIYREADAEKLVKALFEK